MTPQQCEHCVCLREDDNNLSRWYCDQWDRAIEEVPECPEWEKGDKS